MKPRYVASISVSVSDRVPDYGAYTVDPMGRQGIVFSKGQHIPMSVVLSATL